MVIESVEVAVSVRLFAPVSVPSSPARVESVMRFSATEAPRPNDVPETFAAGSAFEVESTLEPPVSVTFPAAVTAPVISAAVVTLPITSENEPAMPTLPPPAPEVASASRLCFSPAPFIPAETLTSVPPAVPATEASFVTFASVIATAAPTFAVPPFVAEPFAFDFASVFAAVASESAPPAVTVVPSAIVEVVELSAMETATAAATEMPPPDVDADGVGVGRRRRSRRWRTRGCSRCCARRSTVSSTPVPGAPADAGLRCPVRARGCVALGRGGAERLEGDRAGRGDVAIRRGVDGVVRDGHCDGGADRGGRAGGRAGRGRRDRGGLGRRRR